ncbi:hypothetical protein KKF29_02730 [Patescibacteria group bacterium]|nr:hypothetical protein [Patescibacteria group bacterium]
MYFYIYDTFVNEKKFEPVLDKLENRLIELGINGRIEKLTVLKNMKTLIEDGIDKGAHTVVAVGDDTTLIKTINFVANHEDIMIGFIPIKENTVFGKIMGLNDITEACNVLSKRLAKVIDLGRASKNYFLGSIQIPNAAGVKIECDGEYKVSTNNQRASLSIKNLGDLFSGDFKEYNARDGLLDIVIAPPALSGFKKMVGREKAEGETIFQAKKLRITSKNGSVPVILDEETTLKTPVDIEIKPKKIKLIVGRERVI